jgi:predicted AAA+ superfamily ATPase
MQLDILATYRADFSKYSKRVPTMILEATLRSIARSIGRKFVYAHVDEGVKHYQAKQALEMLALARVCHIVNYTAANGLPLGGEIKATFRKAILNDVGMLHALLVTPAGAVFPRWDEFSAQVRGQIAEQLGGQQLRLLGPLRGDGPELYYWQREGGRPGEIDFLVQHNGRIFPIELKSGTSGSMKSLHQFMYDKKLDFALRFDRNPPADMPIDVKTTQGDPVRYLMRSLPLYLAGLLANLLDDTAPVA